MTFVEGTVRATVPATSANLGPGFDCLGLALELRDELTARVADAWRIDVEGEGAGRLPRDESHLVARAMRLAFEALGESPDGVHLECRNVVPHSRGLGSSSAAIVGGLAVARALVHDGEVRLPDAELLRLANRLEGHPDNVAPALYGGLVVSGQADGSVWAHRAALDPRIRVVCFVPADGVETHVARGLLPATLPYADAVANTARTALLVAALRDAPELLLRATEDFVHQRFRAPAMPESLTLVDALRADGVAAAVSGAGPTVLALHTTDDAEALLARCPAGWRAAALDVAVDGVRVTPSADTTTATRAGSGSA